MVDEDRATAMYRRRPETVATDRGEGPPLVLGHGTLMDRTMFQPQLSALAPEYRVVTYDSRSRTDQYGTSYDLYDLADDCAALMDGLGIDSAVIGGMSLGGFMALRFAERYPERVDGLVLVDTTAGQHTEGERAQYRQMIETVREAGSAPRELAETVSHFLFGQTTIERNPELVDSWVDRWQTYPGEAIYQEVDAWLDRPDFTPKLDDIDVPALVLHGEEDASLEPSRSDSLVERLDADRVMIPEAGHSSNLENPETANEAIQEFMDETV